MTRSTITTRTIGLLLIASAVTACGVRDKSSPRPKPVTGTTSSGGILGATTFFCLPRVGPTEVGELLATLKAGDEAVVAVTRSSVRSGRSSSRLMTGSYVIETQDAGNLLTLSTTDLDLRLALPGVEFPRDTTITVEGLWTDAAGVVPVACRSLPQAR